MINAQWDFDYRGYFTSTAGFEMQRTKDGEPVLSAEYEFPTTANTGSRSEYKTTSAANRPISRRSKSPDAECPGTKEDEFLAWVDDGYSGSPPETVEFLDEVLDPTREAKLWPGQRAGLLRTIYAFEVMGKRDLLLNIVTGGGKTAIIAACIAWLRRSHDVRSFLIICPNTIVRDRLRTDFQGAKVFYDFELFSPIQSHLVNDLGLHVLEPGAAPQGMLESGS